MTGLELVLDEDERPGADHLGHLLVGRGVRQPLGHHERDGTGNLAQRRQEQRKWPLQSYLEAAVVESGDALRGGGEVLAERVALHPPLQRGNAIGGADRRAVVKLQLVAKYEGID